jgi:FixJ family two-component response regulator
MRDVSQPKPTVFVVDDDAPMRHSLQGLIAALGYEVQAFASAAQFRQHYKPYMAGCLVLDVHLPRQNGLELYAQLLQEGKRLPVIFITGHADVSTAVAAMKTGAIEFLEKPFSRTTLEDRLRKALTIDAQWRGQAAAIADMEDRLSRLNDGERDTLQLILEGHLNKVIARRCGISERGVEMRRARIMSKLDVKSVAELLDFTTTYRILSEIRQLPRLGL